MLTLETDDEKVNRAVLLLKGGNVIGLPTETVYGLAAKISDLDALKKIFQIKKRPFFDPLIVHVSSINQARNQVREWPKSAEILAETFWPGPLTIILNKQKHISDLITSGLETVALRCPKHSLALKIIQEIGEPLAAPSANKFGKTSPSEAIHVIQEFGEEIAVIDGGPCDIGIESTIVKLEEGPNLIELTLFRSGAIGLEEISRALKVLKKEIRLLRPGDGIESPGQIKHHYMPNIPLLFIDEKKWSHLGDAIEEKTMKLNIKLNLNFKNLCILDLPQKPEQAARELYSKLRSSSSQPFDLIVFIKEDHHKGEFWQAILDRLERASTFNLNVK